MLLPTSAEDDAKDIIDSLRKNFCTQGCEAVGPFNMSWIISISLIRFDAADQESVHSISYRISQPSMAGVFVIP